MRRAVGCVSTTLVGVRSRLATKRTGSATALALVQAGNYAGVLTSQGPLASLATAHPDVRKRHFCANSATSRSELDARRKRLIWRAKSRGWLELDVLMGTFVTRNIADFNDEQLDLLEEVLDLENPDLFKWFTGQGEVPDEVKANPVMAMLLAYVKSDHKSGLNDR